MRGRTGTLKARDVTLAQQKPVSAAERTDAQNNTVLTRQSPYAYLALRKASGFY